MSVRTQTVLWAIALCVALSLAGAAAWWVQRPHATIRALPAADIVSDDQAARAAESTVRAFLAARNERNVPNMLALACSQGKRTFAIPYTSEQPDPELGSLDAVHVGRFTRDQEFGTLPVFYRSAGAGYGGEVFGLGVQNGELRICTMGPPAPW